MARKGQTERELEASFLVAQAISELEEIVSAKPQYYADRYTNSDRGYNATRPFTLKDAKPRAILAVNLLRQAWDILDPPIETFESKESTIELGDDDELWNADPNCKHNIVSSPGGGIKCTKCGGWFCY